MRFVNFVDQSGRIHPALVIHTIEIGQDYPMVNLVYADPEERDSYGAMRKLETSINHESQVGVGGAPYWCNVMYPEKDEEGAETHERETEEATAEE